MWAQMDARMAQFMEAMLTVTRNQEELRVLVETPRGHRPFEYRDVSAGKPRPNLADFKGLNLDGNHANGHGNAGRNQGLHGGPVGNQGFISGNQGNPNFNQCIMDMFRHLHHLLITVLKLFQGICTADIRVLKPIKELEKEKVEKVEEEIVVISIPYTPKRILAPARPVPLVVTMPGPVLYSSEKAVPWHYGSDVYYHGIKQVFIPVLAKKEEVEKEDVNAGDFSGAGRITRSGRVFAPPNSQDVADALEKAKEKQVDDGPRPVQDGSRGISSQILLSTSSLFNPKFKRYSEDRVSLRSLEGAHENPGFEFSASDDQSTHVIWTHITFALFTRLSLFSQKRFTNLLIFDFSLKPETEFRTETHFLEIGV
ncbi:hypothetical protein KIW84_056056 [Lathyrus oleraceus]|uniref:Uncharacterized protein n=1 Tax=Pisum sativum TaxID=3888 RepID=A0A9D4WZG5_PEA|nr:hypothetical protein KIW84_056056 [Pisum sativum]